MHPQHFSPHKTRLGGSRGWQQRSSLPPPHQCQHLPPRGRGRAEAAGHGGDAGRVLLICRGSGCCLTCVGELGAPGGERGDGDPRGGETAYRQKMLCRRITCGKARRVCLLFGVTSARTGPVFPASPSSRGRRGWLHGGSDGRGSLAFSMRSAGPWKTCSSSSAERATFPNTEVAPPQTTPRSQRDGAAATPRSQGQRAPSHPCCKWGNRGREISPWDAALVAPHTLGQRCPPRSNPPHPSPLLQGKWPPRSQWEEGSSRQAAPDSSTVPGQPRWRRGSLSPWSQRLSSAQAGQPRLTAPCRESEPELRYEAPGSVGEGRC